MAREKTTNATATRSARPVALSPRLFIGDSQVKRLLVITIVVFVIMSLLRPDRFFTWDNFTSMAFQFPEFGLLALAMTLTMLTGGIDLSIVGIANFSGILAALILTRMLPPDAEGVQVVIVSLMAIGVAVFTGVLCGLLNGLLVGYVGITPILATLGTMQLYTGIAVVITRGAAVYGFPDMITFLGNGSIWIFPVPFLIFAAFAVAFSIVLNRTPYGFKLYMLGTNPTAARFSGIHSPSLLLKTYVVSGLLAAVAGFVVLARTNSAKADYGASYTLQAILIAVLGGVNPAGGFGTVAGVVLAVLTLQFLSSGFNMLRFSNFFKEFIWGAVLLLVMVVNYMSNTRALRRQSLQATGDKGQGQATLGNESHA